MKYSLWIPIIISKTEWITLKKVRTGLKANGKLTILDYKKDESITDGPPMSIRLTPQEVVKELKQAGFENIMIIDDFLTRQYIVQAYANKQVSGSEFMKEFFDEEYAKEEYIFGKNPDEYLTKVLPQFQPGKILFPGEGEGRNAVYAAELGWDVTAYDYSESAKIKADKLAKANHVDIDYSVQDIITANYPEESFDAIAYLFLHFEGEERRKIHKNFDKQLKKGGILIIENFSTEHPKYSKEGPQEEKNLYSKEDIYRDFPDYEIIELKVERDTLYDGGSPLDCSVLRFVGRKK